MTLFIQDLLFNWTLSNMPTIAVCITLMWFTAWATVRIVDFRNRLAKTEADSEELKKDHKTLKKTVRRIDQKVTRLDSKLDKLITYLTATKTVDFKDR
jgi:hypothetical protein